MIKLTKCYIRGFGKYIDKEIKFDSNLSEFLDENGAGKTTLCDFIRAMFYGFRTAKKNQNNYAERNKYKPWDSDNFGGNISFTYNGKDYVIDRTFDIKSNTKDTVKLFENNKELDVSKIDNLGFRFLELNEESFERTLFINGLNLNSALEKDADITGRISKELGQIDSSYNIDEVLKGLKEQYKIYGEAKKGDSHLRQVKEGIENIDEQISEKRKKIASLNVNEDRLKEIEKAKVKNEEDRKLCKQRDEYFRKKNLHESLLKEIKSNETKKRDILTEFKNEIATEEEVNEINKLLASLETLKRIQSRKQTIEEVEVVEPKHKSSKVKWIIVLAVIFMCLAVAGAVFKWAFAYEVVGLSLLCVGAGCLVISATAFFICRSFNKKKQDEVKIEPIKVEEADNTSKEIEELEAKINRFKQKYEIEDVEAFVKTCKKAREEIKKCEHQIELLNKQSINNDFKEDLYFENKVRPLPSTDKLEDTNNSLIAEETEINGAIKTCESLKLEINDLEFDRKEKENLVEEYNKKAELIKKTISAMEETQEQIKNRITEPLLSKFKGYSEELENIYGNKIVITPDLKLKVENKGVSYEIEHLSSGELTLVSFAFRLSLISTLFKDGIPFLILDDPFVLLDDKHIEKTKSFIKKISKDVQILYFTCHNSRRIK